MRLHVLQVCIYKGFCVKNGSFAIIMKLYSYSLANRVSHAPGGDDGGRTRGQTNPSRAHSRRQLLLSACCWAAGQFTLNGTCQRYALLRTEHTSVACAGGPFM